MSEGVILAEQVGSVSLEDEEIETPEEKTCSGPATEPIH